MKEKKLRIEDALNATRAAVEEGIVAGGGTAYLNAIPAVEKLLAESEGDEKTGASIVLKALEEPVRQIAANAGIELCHCGAAEEGRQGWLRLQRPYRRVPGYD